MPPTPGEPEEAVPPVPPTGARRAQVSSSGFLVDFDVLHDVVANGRRSFPVAQFGVAQTKQRLAIQIQFVTLGEQAILKVFNALLFAINHLRHLCGALVHRQNVSGEASTSMR